VLATSWPFRIHGHDRGSEVLEAIGRGTANVVEHIGRITGYTTGVGFFGHAVGESNEDLKALIGAAPEFPDRASCCRRATARCCAGAWSGVCASSSR
jgi:hypothetical protein